MTESIEPIQALACTFSAQRDVLAFRPTKGDLDMSMIEQAARALAKAQSGSDDWEGLDGALQDQLMAEARAVIQSIREPSREMGQAGEALLGNARGHSVDGDDLCDAWTVMIDTLLNKGVSG